MSRRQKYNMYTAKARKNCCEKLTKSNHSDKYGLSVNYENCTEKYYDMHHNELIHNKSHMP
jgi:hypothetical protein